MLCDTLTEKPLAHMDDAPECPIELPASDVKKATLEPEQVQIVRNWLHKMKAWQKTHSLVANDMHTDYDDFASRLMQSQKFFLTKDFADCTLNRLATPETVEKAKQYYALTHNPMWVEWKHRELTNCNLGAILWQDECDAEAGVTRAYFVHYMEHLNLSEVPTAITFHKVGFVAASLQIHDGEVSMDVTDETEGESKIVASFSKLVTDFIIRLNSPRITEFRACDDLSKINKKRTRTGKLPLCTYQIVDLTREIKADMKLANYEGEGGTRFHWRRGHFKILSGPRYKEPGLHWWNPHTAGRRANGEIRKEYVA